MYRDNNSRVQSSYFFVFFGRNLFLVPRSRDGIIVFCLRRWSESIPLARACIYGSGQGSGQLPAE